MSRQPPVVKLMDIFHLISEKPSIASQINAALTTEVPKDLTDRLNNLNDVTTAMWGEKDLVVKKSQLADVLTRLQMLLFDSANTFSTANNSSTTVSPAQSDFISSVTQLTVNLQTYIQLMNRHDVIKYIYDLVSSSALLSHTNIQDISTLLLSAAIDKSDDYVHRITQNTTTTFQDIRNLDAIVNDIENSIKIRKRISNSSYMFVMLTGPPGTGKTSLARAIASYHSNGEYQNLDMSALLGGVVGETEKRVTELFRYFNKNRHQNYTLIMDELDIVLGESSSTDYIRTLKNTIQTALDPDNLGPNLVIVGLTNHFDNLNKVMKRRTTSVHYIPLPQVKDAVDFLIAEIEKPFSMFAIESGQPLSSSGSSLSTAYTTGLQNFFANMSNLRFSNANMKNIATVAISHALKAPLLHVYDYMGNSSSTKLRICCSNPEFLAMDRLATERTRLENTHQSLPIDAIISEMDYSNGNIFHSLYTVPNIITDIAAGISQTVIMTVQDEREYKRKNQVNDATIDNNSDSNEMEHDAEIPTPNETRTVATMSR